MPPTLDDIRPAPTDPASEYLPGGCSAGASAYYPGARVLPKAIDDVTRAYGPQLYETMLLDATIAGAIAKLFSTVLSGRVHVVPTDRRVPGRPDTPEATRAEEVAEDNRRNLARLRVPIEDVLREMAYAVAYGNKLAEVVREEGLIDGRHALKAIAPKPHWAWRFGVDHIGNVVGYLPPAGYAATAAPTAGGTIDGQTLLDPRHFALLTWDSRDGGPQGTSLLRPCYPWWNEARQAGPDFRTFVRRFAHPKPVGRFLPPAGDSLQRSAATSNESYSYASALIPVYDPATGLAKPDEFVPAWAAFLGALRGWDNDSALLVPEGGIVELMEPKSDGAAFERFFNFCDRMKATAILTSARAVMEAEHGSRADSQTADSGVDSVAYMLGRWLGRWLRGIFFNLNADNFGLSDARRYTPEFTIGDESSVDRVALMGAAVGAGYKFAPSQLGALDAALDVPVRLEGEEAIGEAPAPAEPTTAAQDDQANPDAIRPGKKA